MKLKHVGMIVVSVLAMSSAAVSAAEGDESVTTTVNGGVIHFTKNDNIFKSQGHLITTSLLLHLLKRVFAKTFYVAK